MTKNKLPEIGKFYFHKKTKVLYIFETFGINYDLGIGMVQLKSQADDSNLIMKEDNFWDEFEEFSPEKPSCDHPSIFKGTHGCTYGGCDENMEKAAIKENLSITERYQKIEKDDIWIDPENNNELIVVGINEDMIHYLYQNQFYKIGKLMFPRSFKLKSRDTKAKEKKEDYLTLEDIYEKPITEEEKPLWRQVNPDLTILDEDVVLDRLEKQSEKQRELEERVKRLEKALFEPSEPWNQK